MSAIHGFILAGIHAAFKMDSFGIFNNFYV